MSAQVIDDMSQLMGPILVKAIINFAKARAAWETGWDLLFIGKGVVTIYLLILLTQLGPSAVAGFSLFVFIVPIQEPVETVQNEGQVDEVYGSACKDLARSLDSMRVVKYFGYEISFLKRIYDIRANEPALFSLSYTCHESKDTLGFPSKENDDTWRFHGKDPQAAANSIRWERNTEADHIVTLEVEDMKEEQHNRANDALSAQRLCAPVPHEHPSIAADDFIFHLSITIAVEFSLPILASTLAFVTYSRVTSGFDINALGRFDIKAVFNVKTLNEAPFTIDPAQEYALDAKGVSFEWESTMKEEEAKGKGKGGKKAMVSEKEKEKMKIMMRIPRGTLAGFVGHVGAGKSSLMQGMRRIGGVAYYAQTAWIHNATVGVSIDILLSMAAAKNLHHNSVRNISFALMSYFDTIPLGRIVGIFGKDTDTMVN
ncbi:hypothetical protein B0H19DRAFT_1382882 [Mycena capillaripes]|nr:hypothetical protein B0H19DRAFT_1382882 [Mycena capillaripes]